MYAINIHAHTIFSDGMNTPLGMAYEANNLGLTALVITDHYYGINSSLHWASLNIEKFKLLERSTKEAKAIIPVILGMELAFGGEEILVFGSRLIQGILHMEKDVTMDYLMNQKAMNDCAFVLCHPGREENWTRLRPLLDGYEEYNSGNHYFRDGRSHGALEGLPGWCNSDAHQASGLGRAYNLVDSKITVESDLIRYIKRGKRPEPWLRGEEKSVSSATPFQWPTTVSFT